MAEPYFQGGPKPQSLDKTFNDFARLGKGLLVGETADILGLPADLLGLYYDVRYGQTPEGIQSLINTIGSEALAKKFMGEEFPEFSFENFGKDENLESAGRLLAPGALLTKAIASARLAARLKNPPEGGIGSLGDQQLALAGAGAGKVPMGAGEQLLMTRADDGSGAVTPTPMPKQARLMDDDAFLKRGDDVKLGSVLSKDGEIFSNLLNEIEKIGTGDSQLSRTQLEGIGQPVMESFVTDKGKKVSRPKLDAQGKKIYNRTEEVTTGINFANNPTGAAILESFGKLPGGKNNRLYKEAREVGLLRYLELNPDEVFSQESGKAKLYNIASQFTPEVTAITYKQSDVAQIRADIIALESLKTNAVTQAEKDRLSALIKDKQDLESRTVNAMNNVQEQRIDPGPRNQNADGTFGTVATDNVHIMFGRGERGEELVGKDILKADNDDPPEVKEALSELETFLKDAGDTDSLAKLKSIYGVHSYTKTKAYDGHGRLIDTFGSPTGSNLEPSRFINELQFNSARFKENQLRTPEQVDKIKAKITELQNQAQNNSDPFIVQALSDQVRALKKMLETKDIVLNEDLVDVQQILKVDKQKGGKLVKFKEIKEELRKKSEQLTTEIADLQTNKLLLDSNLTRVKRAGFQLDENLIKNTTVFDNFKNNEAYLQNWFDNVDDTALITNIEPRAPGETIGEGMIGGIEVFHNNRYGTKLENGVEIPKSPNDPFFETPERMEDAGMRLPLSIARFIGSSGRDRNFTLERVLKFYTDLTPPRTAQLSPRTNAVDKFIARSADDGMIISGDTVTQNPFVTFLASGQYDKIRDVDMIQDHFKTLENLVKSKKVDPNSFKLHTNLAERKEFFDEMSSGKKHRLDMFTETGIGIKYGDYIAAKLLDDPMYFMKRGNTQKFFKDALKNYGQVLEQKVLQDRITMNILTNEEFIKNVGKQNIQEYKARLKDIETRARAESLETNPAFNDETKKVYEDFLTDAEIEFKSAGTGNIDEVIPTGKGAKIVKKIVEQTVDEHLQKYNSIPLPENTGNNVLMANTLKGGSLQGRRNVVDVEYIPTKRKILGMEMDVIQGELKLDYKNFGTPQKKEATVRNASFAKSFDAFSRYQNPLLLRLAKQEEFDALRKEEAALSNVIKNKQDELDRVKIELRPYEKRNAISDIIKQYADEIPTELVGSLNKLISHASRSKTLGMNPSYQNTNQAIELAVNSIVKQAIKDGKRYVVFPKLRDYTYPRNSGPGHAKSTTYNASAGDPLTNILKKNFGDGYFTSDEFFGSRVQTGRAQRIGSRGGVDMNNSPIADDALPGNVDKSKFRIIDLTKINPDFKIPRFAKGGILSKFRKKVA